MQTNVNNRRSLNTRPLRLQWILMCPFAFLVAPKLLGRLDLSWWWVTLPIWILPAIYIAGMLLILVQTFVYYINDQVFGYHDPQQP